MLIKIIILAVIGLSGCSIPTMDKGGCKEASKLNDLSDLRKYQECKKGNR